MAEAVNAAVAVATVWSAPQGTQLAGRTPTGGSMLSQNSVMAISVPSSYPTVQQR